MGSENGKESNKCSSSEVEREASDSSSDSYGSQEERKIPKKSKAEREQKKQQPAEGDSSVSVDYTQRENQEAQVKAYNAIRAKAKKAAKLGSSQVSTLILGLP